MSAGKVRRAFVDVAEGQVHYRHAAPAAATGKLPLVMLHASPGSSNMLMPLITAFAATRPVVATDTLGNGDSSAPVEAKPSIPYFADAHMRALDGIGIERFDLYGSHTGGSIACEIAIRHPGRVNRLVFDGMSLYSDEERADMLQHYAREYTIDEEGTQFGRVWHFVRDAYLFWPWYRRGAAQRRDVGLPSAEVLHDKVVEVLKALRTYHHSYRAAIGYHKSDRLPQVSVPTLLACARTDMLLRYMDQVGALMPKAEQLVTPGISTPVDLAATVAGIAAFLDRA